MRRKSRDKDNRVERATEAAHQRGQSYISGECARKLENKLEQVQ